MESPLPIRFSGTCSPDGDIVLSLSPPLGQHVQRGSLWYRMRPRCHLRGRPRSPTALAPAFSKVGTLSPVWCGLAWPGPGRGVNVTPPALCGYEPGEGLPAWSCPWSLGHPLPPAEPQVTVLQMYNTEHRGAYSRVQIPLPKSCLNTRVS